MAKVLVYVLKVNYKNGNSLRKGYTNKLTRLLAKKTFERDPLVKSCSVSKEWIEK